MSVPVPNGPAKSESEASSLEVNASAKQAPVAKTVFVQTFGCQMNVYDSERIVEALKPEGYTETASAEGADLIVLNTCHIREKAAAKMYSQLGRLAKNAEKSSVRKPPVVAVAGCVAQAEGREIARRASSVGVVVGPQSYHRLPELLTRHRESGKPVVELDFPAEEKFETLPKARLRSSPSAFLTVQEGCDKFCTFCVVPYTRGSEYSRPVTQIVDEANRLVETGAVEITLLGQNVNAYRGAGANGTASNLAELLNRLSQISGLERLRFTTSHPNDMDDELIDAHRDMPKLMPYLHLPFQSGSDRILKAMNRNHTAADYLNIVARLRLARADVALSTDIIVGFPGESDLDFEETLALVHAVGFAQSFSFKYSRRPGTPASEKPAQVEEEAKAERLLHLQAVLKRQQQEFNETTVGAVLPVLWEMPGRKPGTIMGRSPYLQTVEAVGNGVVGKITDCKITSASPNNIRGVICGTEACDSVA